MKRTTIKHKLLTTVILAFLSLNFYANGKTEFKKEVKKSFSVNADATLDIESSFGSVELSNWDKNEVDIHIEIIADAKTESDAEKFFDKVDIDIDGSSSKVSISTELEGSNKHYSEEWSINIYIKMPPSLSLDIEHSFGDLDINEANGRCEIDLSYGSLDANSLGNNNNEVDVDFGSGDIDYFGGGQASVEYGDLDIDKINGDVELECSYGELEVDFISKKCKELTVSCDFGETNITIESGSSYDVETSSSFGDVDIDGEFNISSEDEDMFDTTMKGHIGSKGSGTMEVDCSFGSVDIEID